MGMGFGLVGWMNVCGLLKIQTNWKMIGRGILIAGRTQWYFLCVTDQCHGLDIRLYSSIIF